MTQIHASQVNPAQQRISMRTCRWILFAAVYVLTLPRWSYAQDDPQVGQYGGLIGSEEFFNSVADGPHNVCFEVVALRPPDPELGRYVVRYSIYTSSPEKSDYRDWKALTKLKIDGKDLTQLKTPSSYVGGWAYTTTGKHTFSFSVSSRSRIRLVMVMQTTRPDNVKVADVKHCREEPSSSGN